MKEIKIVTDKIKDEIEDVEKYLRLAVEHKETDADAYAIYLNLANEEYTHAMKLHDLAVREVGKAKKVLLERNEEIPQYMLDVWNSEHKRYIERMGIIKYKLELSKK